MEQNYSQYKLENPCEYKVHVHGGGGENITPVPVCKGLYVCNRQILMQDSASGSLPVLMHGGGSVNPCLSNVLSFFSQMTFFFKHLFCEQKGEGYTSALSA